MICEYFTFSDTDESVLDLSEFKKVAWKNNIQSFDALWDETRIAMKKQPDEEILEIFVNIVSFVVHCKVQFNKVHRESAPDFKKMVWTTIFVRNISQILKSPPLPQLQQGTDNKKVSALEEISVGMKARSRERCENPKGKRKGFATLQLSATEFFGTRNSDRKETCRKGKPSQRASPLKSVIVQRRMLLITGIHLRVPFHQWRNGNLAISVRFGMRNKAGGEPKKRTNSVVVAKTLEKSLR